MRSVEATIAESLEQHQSEYLGYVRARGAGEQDVGDIYQDACLKAFQSRDKLRDPERFKYWFYRILATTVSDFHRKRAREQHQPLQNPDHLEARPNRARVICRCGVALLKRINPGYAQVLQRTLLANEPVEAVADSLGISRSTLWVRLHRARVALRRKLQGHCYFPSGSLRCGCALGTLDCCCS